MSHDDTLRASPFRNLGELYWLPRIASTVGKMACMNNTHKEKATPLFIHYTLQLILRVVVFGIGVWLFITDPVQLDVRRQFGPIHGLSFVNVVFVLLALDLLSKLRPNAKIAMGSRKQYGTYHVPTPRLFEGGLRELREHAMQLIQNAPARLGQALEETRQAVVETAQGMREAGRQVAFTIDILRVLPWSEEDLTASELLREDIRRQRMREIVPVLAFWIVSNIAVGLLLERFGLFNERTAMLWMLFYFLFDMICVVLWCPLQLVLMRNRCCTTCQIFNWDGIMTVTPLIPLLCWFSNLLVALSLVVLARWELAFVRHPERFDERTNASLQCVNCTDKLCHLRQPLRPRTRD